MASWRRALRSCAAVCNADKALACGCRPDPCSAGWRTLQRSTALLTGRFGCATGRGSGRWVEGQGPSSPRWQPLDGGRQQAYERFTSTPGMLLMPCCRGRWIGVMRMVPASCSPADCMIARTSFQIDSNDNTSGFALASTCNTPALQFSSWRTCLLRRLTRGQVTPGHSFSLPFPFHFRHTGLRASTAVQPRQRITAEQPTRSCALNTKCKCQRQSSTATRPPAASLSHSSL